MMVFGSKGGLVVVFTLAGYDEDVDVRFTTSELRHRHHHQHRQPKDEVYFVGR